MRLQSPASGQPAESILYEAWLSRLLKFWAVFALITFVVMLTHQSDNPDLLGRYSKLVAAQLVVLLGITVISAGSGFWLARNPRLSSKINDRLNRWRANPMFPLLVIVIAAILLVIIWVFILGNQLPTYGFLRLFMASSILIGATALLYGGSQAKEAAWKLWPIIIIAILVCVLIAILPYFPALAKTDESFVFSMGRNALENGHVAPFIYRQAFPENYYGGVWTWTMAGWLKMAGISLTSGRLYVLVLGLIASGFLYIGTARLYDKVTAWFAVLIGIYAFGSLNHIRFDIHVAFWLSIGIFFYSLTNNPKAWWSHIATGFAIGMCIDSNPIGYCFGLGVFFVYLWNYIKSIGNKHWLYIPFWLMAVGGGAALLLFLRIHSGDTFAGGQSTSDLSSTYIGTIKNNFVSGLYISQVSQYLYAFLTGQPILFGLMVAGILTAFIERTKADRFLLILYFTWMAVVVFAYFYFPLFYLMLALPLFVLLAARGVARGLPMLIGTVSHGANTLTRTTTILLSVWLFAAIIYGLMKLPSDSLEDVVETGHEIGQTLPQDATVVAAEPYYFGMLNDRNFVGGAIESFMVNFKKMPPEMVWSQINPDAIIFSQNWPNEPQQSPALMSYMTEQHFGLQACYETKSFGQIELWTRNGTAGPDATITCAKVCNPRTGC